MAIRRAGVANIRHHIGSRTGRIGRLMWDHARLWMKDIDGAHRWHDPGFRGGLCFVASHVPATVGIADVREPDPGANGQTYLQSSGIFRIIRYGLRFFSLTIYWDFLSEFQYSSEAVAEI